MIIYRPITHILEGQILRGELVREKLEKMLNGMWAFMYRVHVLVKPLVCGKCERGFYDE